MLKSLRVKLTTIFVLAIFALPMVLMTVPSVIPTASAAGLIIPTTGYTAACAVEPYTTTGSLSMTPANAIDGTVTDASRWAYSSGANIPANQTTTTKYVTFDFGSSKTFNTLSFWMDRQIALVGANFTSLSLQYGNTLDTTLTGQTPTTMTFSTSSGNDIIDGSQTIKKYTTSRLENITARYVRFAFTYTKNCAIGTASTSIPTPVEINLSYDFGTIIPTTAYTGSCANSLYTSIASLSSTLPPSKSIDGDFSYASRWAYSGTTWTNGQKDTKYVTYDLGAVKTFNEMTFYRLSTQTNFTFDSCSIQVSDTLDSTLTSSTPLTLTFNVNAGDNYNNGAVINKHTTPKFADKSGRYVRLGFNYTSTTAESGKSPAMPIEILLGNSLSISYDANGSLSGTVPTDNKKYFSSNNVTVLGNTGTLEKPGYTFAGWNTAANGSGTDYAANATFSIGSSNVTLYAQWTVVNYSFTEDLIITMPVKSGNIVTVNVDNTTGSNKNGVIIIGSFATTGNKNMNGVMTKSIVITPGVNTYSIDISQFAGYAGATTKVFILNNLTQLRPYSWNFDL